MRSSRRPNRTAALATGATGLAAGLLLLTSSCGGGGGGSGPAAGNPARLAATGLVLAPTATTGELSVSLADLPATAPVLVQITIELPPALTVAATDPLVAVQPVERLDGNRKGNVYRVVCGDDRNPQGTPLQNGELFRLRLVATTPRQIGDHVILLREPILALSDGAAADTDPNPVTVTATVR